MTKKQLKLLLWYIDCKVAEQSAEEKEMWWDRDYYRGAAKGTQEALFETIKENT